MKKQLIITGHDLGFSESVNEGFEYIRASGKKVFSELSLLPNGFASNTAVDIAKSFELPVNLCFCLTNSKFKALTGPSSLTTEDGYLKNADTKNWDFSVIDAFDPVDIEKELIAQYEWFVTNMGRKPSALVAQKGEYGDPKVLEPFVTLAKKENLPVRAPWWRWKTNYGAQSFVEAEGITTTQGIFMGIKDWRGRLGYDLEVDLEQLLHDIDSNEGVSELILFVGFCSKEMFAMSSVSWQRGQILNIVKRKYHIIERLFDEFDIIGFSGI